MKIELDKNKCVNCGECMKNCPYMTDTYSSNIFKCDNCGICANVCPEKAIYQVNGIYKIDYDKCTNCGICVEACPKNAIIPQKNGKPAKCDLCMDKGKPQCMAVCPYNALSLSYSETEKKFIEKIIGWKKLKKEQGTLVAIYENNEIIKIGEERHYITQLKEVNYDEALLIEKALNAFRKEKNPDEATAEEIIEQYCDLNNITITQKQIEKLTKIIKQETKGYSALDPLLEDENLEEIAIVGKQKPVFVYHKQFGWLETDIMFASDDKIKNIINKIGRKLGRRVSTSNPRINADVEFGRIHAAIPPASEEPSITIRKFNSKPFTTTELAEKTITPEALAFLKMALNSDANLLICGNTGSGKTSTLNTLLSFLPEKDRVIAIEETPELKFSNKNAVRLIADEKNTMAELVADSLRMRPDRVIVGEVRKPSEAKALVNTMLAGQGKSSFATFHAQNSEEALIRMKTMGISDVDLNAFDLILVQKRWTNAGKNKIERKVTEISYVKKNYNSKPSIEKIFKYDYEKEKLQRTESEPKELIERICNSYEIKKDEFKKQLEKEKQEIEKNAFIRKLA